MKKHVLYLLAFLLLLTPLAVSAETRGDLNGDGKLTAWDCVQMKAYVLGARTLTDAQKMLADMDGDGDIDGLDCMKAKYLLLNTPQAPEESVPQEESKSESPEETVPSEPEEPSVPNTTLAKQVLALVNAERAKQGLGGLTLSAEVCNVATVKAQDMADNGYFDHNSPTYGTPFDMLTSFGVSYASAGENIAAGQQTAEEVVESWMNSEGHRANILNASYTELGVGVAYGGEYGIYWVQMFVGK